MLKAVRIIGTVLVAALLLLSLAPNLKAQQTTLTFWTFLSPTDQAPRSKVQSMLIDSFVKKYPNVKVDVQVLPWAEISPRLIQAVAAGKAPDVTRIANDSFLTQYAAGTLLPLDEFTDKWSKSERDDWVLPWEEGLYKGHKMAIWIEHRVVMLWYRKDYLDMVSAAVPKTWDEVGKVGAALTQKGKIGFAVGLSTGGAGNSIMEWFKPVIWSLGGETVTPEGKAIFNSPAGVKSMQTLHDLVHKHKAIPMEVLQWDVDGTFQGVQAGRAAMVTWATHRVVTARQGAGVGDNLVTAPVPSFDAAKPSPGHVTGWNLAMTPNTKNKDLAWKFIDHMTNTEAQILNAKVAGELPSRKSAYQDPWFKEDKLGAEMTQWKEYLEKAGRIPLFPKDYLLLHRVIAEAAQEIVLSNSPIQKTLDQAVEKYNKQAGF